MISALFKSPTVWKFVGRHIATIIGTYSVTRGITTSSGWDDVLGAIAVIWSFCYSAWCKREIIKADVANTIAVASSK